MRTPTGDEVCVAELPNEYEVYKLANSPRNKKKRRRNHIYAEVRKGPEMRRSRKITSGGKIKAGKEPGRPYLTFGVMMPSRNFVRYSTNGGGAAAATETGPTGATEKELHRSASGDRTDEARWRETRGDRREPTPE